MEIKKLRPVSPDLPDHARLGPSSSSRWLKCPGSAKENLDDEIKPATLAGTVGHDMAAAYLETQEWMSILLEDHVLKACQAIEGLDPGVAEEVAACCGGFVDYVHSVLKEGDELYVENKVWHDKIEDFGGTIDVLIHRPETNSLIIIDLKTGKWKVSGKRNTQVRCYAVLARQEFPEVEEITVMIYQPRVYKKPQKVILPSEELDAFQKLVEKRGTQTEIYIPGDHCFFCPLRGNGCDEYDKWLAAGKPNLAPPPS